MVENLKYFPVTLGMIMKNEKYDYNKDILLMRIMEIRIKIFQQSG